MYRLLELNSSCDVAYLQASDTKQGSLHSHSSLISQLDARQIACILMSKKNKNIFENIFTVFDIHHAASRR
jgi:hypothetical protein